MLLLRVLGTPTLQLDGQLLGLAIRKTWALLVHLAVDGPTPRARLAARLWPGLDESTARRNLRRELARLREAGATALVAAQGDLLALGRGVALDLRDFDQALQAGRPEDALAHYGGPLAEGLQAGDTAEYDQWLQAEREQLHTRWRTALWQAAQQAEALSRSDVALVHLGTLLADDPLTESHHFAVMRLHAAAGRPDAALAQYARCRTVLLAELGLAPMADTEALAQRLRMSDLPKTSSTTRLKTGTSPVLANAAMSGSQAAAASSTSPAAACLPDTLPFVGRSAEVHVLQAAWLSGRAVVVEGEAGVGKTRLALDFAAAHGALAMARCRAGDAEVPYAAFARALRTLAGPLPHAPGLQALQGTPPWVIAELARLLPELGAAPPPIHTTEERSRFFEACAQGWLALAADNFDAVVLDDWHHADAASRSLLAYMARRRRELVPSTAREWLLMRPGADAHAVPQLCTVLDALHLRLGPLEPTAVLDLVRLLSGASEPLRFARRLQQATAGNPFFLSETLRLLSEQQLLQAGADGVWRTPFDDATQDYHELPVPTSVRDAVLARVNRLDGACVRVLEAAALAAEPFAPGLLAPACALSELDTVLAIEQAVQAQLVREHPAGGYAFAHDLVQQALDQSLGPDRRRLVHRRLALGAEAVAAPPALTAAHFEASGELRRAVPHRLAAGQQAQRLHGQAEAIEHWRKGLADDPSLAQSLALHLCLMRGLRLTDQREASRRHATQALALATNDELPEADRSAALLELAGEFAREERAEEALRILQRLPAVLAETQQIAAMNVRATALRELGRVDEAAAIGRAALEMPALRGRMRADLLDALVLTAHRSGRLGAALELAAESLAISRELGDELGMARGLNRRGIFMLEGGDLAGAEAELQQAVAQCERLGLVGLQRGSLYNLCCLYSGKGLPSQVLACAQRIWALQPPMERSELRVMVHLAFVDAQIALGHLGDAWLHAQAAADDALASGQPLAAATVVLTAIELFGLLGARATAERLQASLSDAALGQMLHVANEMWTARAHFELLVGDVAAAGRTLAQIESPAQIESGRIQLRHGVVSAECALARGDALAALAVLPADSAPGMNEEMRLLSLAVRLGAEVLGGAAQPTTLQAVQAALEADDVHTVSALALVRALSAARRHAPGSVPVDLHARAATLVARLAASLQAHPAQQAAFVRIHG
jgi:DNA-binding SARP family transcriptional activator/tetratricopeptide (TPR) repeat protein